MLRFPFPEYFNWRECSIETIVFARCKMRDKLRNYSPDVSYETIAFDRSSVKFNLCYIARQILSQSNWATVLIYCNLIVKNSFVYNLFADFNITSMKRLVINNLSNLQNSRESGWKKIPKGKIFKFPYSLSSWRFSIFHKIPSSRRESKETIDRNIFFSKQRLRKQATAKRTRSKRNYEWWSQSLVLRSITDARPLSCIFHTYIGAHWIFSWARDYIRAGERWILVDPRLD